MPQQYGTGWLSSFIRRALAVLVLVYVYVVFQIQSVLVSEEEGAGKHAEFFIRHNEIPTVSIEMPEQRPDLPKIKLQDKLDQVYRTTGHPYEEYFEWHKTERQRVISSTDPKIWKSTRLLVMQCLKEQDNKCGGTADRMKPFLFALRQAYLSKRLLVIHWTLPARLEEFLVPPKGGYDWRAPETLHNMVGLLQTSLFCRFRHCCSKENKRQQ
eukprot:scaffold5817_cov101-Cylindrotheca_fusiformis.AAC.12